METSASLLDRLQSAAADEDWQRLVRIYDPFIRRAVRRLTESNQDTDDVVQDVLSVVFRKLPSFRRARTGSFRTWLRTITTNCLRDRWKTRRFRPIASGNGDFDAVLEQFADPKGHLSVIWNEEHDRHVLRELLKLIEPTIRSETWQAFYRTAVLNEAPETVASSLGVTLNAVYIARSRVMTRLRQEGRGLLEEDSEDN